MAKEIFISYSRKDFDKVKAIKDEIDREVGIDCWMDLDGIESGEQFKKVIIKAINEHDTFLFMLSTSSMASPYALKELGFAANKRKRVILVFIEPCQMTDDFLFDYQDYDNIDWNNTLQHNKLLGNLHKWFPGSLQREETIQSVAEKTGARIFISYKRADKDKVFPLKDQIEAAIGEPCWVDLEGIESDASFVESTIRSINAAEIFLFMYSKHQSDIKNYSTDWAIRELNYAIKNRKHIVFVNLDGTPLARWFAYMFPQQQQVDATNPQEIEQLINVLCKWLNVPKQKLASKPLTQPKPQPLLQPQQITKPRPQPKPTPAAIAKPVVMDSLEQENQDELRLTEAENAFNARKYGAAIPVFKELAQKGNARALYWYGVAFENGLGTKRAINEAWRCYAESAKQGYIPAFSKLNLPMVLQDTKKKILGSSLHYMESMAEMVQNDQSVSLIRISGKHDTGAVIGSLSMKIQKNDKPRDVEGEWHFTLRADIRTYGYKGQNIGVLYYLYPADLDPAEVVKIVSKNPNSRKTKNMAGYWKMTVPYHGTQWANLPIRITESYFPPFERGEKRKYSLHVAVWDMATDKHIAEKSCAFTLQYTKPLLGRETFSLYR